MINPQKQNQIKKAQTGILTLMIVILLLIALSLYLVNQNKAKTQDFSVEENNLNLFLKQSLVSLINTETRYKGNGQECDSFGLILSLKDPYKVCNKNSEYKNESTYNITNRILKAYYEYLNHIDNSFYYYILVEHDNPVIVNGHPVIYAYGNSSLTTYEGEKISATEKLPTHAIFRNSNEKIRIIAVKKHLNY